MQLSLIDQEFIELLRTMQQDCRFEKSFRFLESVERWGKRNGFLTEAQRSSVEKIYREATGEDSGIM